MSNVLIVLSAADTWIRADGAGYPTGYWAGEFVDVHQTLRAAECSIDIATPGARRPTADPHSLDPEKAGPSARKHAEYLKGLAAALEEPLALSSVDMREYAAVLVPGGHGPVVDLYKDEAMGRILMDAEKAGKVIGAVCHGQAALLAAKDADGGWPFAGRKMTAISNEEEEAFDTANNAPRLLVDRLRAAGADYTQASNWTPYVVRDGNLITGQNPASSAPMAEAVLQALEEQKAAAAEQEGAAT